MIIIDYKEVATILCTYLPTYYYSTKVFYYDEDIEVSEIVTVTLSTQNNPYFIEDL